MYEKLLIQNGANFVPSIHLKNGVFGLSRHCITFSQDITKMCDELPQRRETLLTCIRSKGNKDTSPIFPTRFVVNRQKIVDALLWLKKHNTCYRNIKIQNENFD